MLTYDEMQAAGAHGTYMGLGLALREHILKVPLAPAACISSIYYIYTPYVHTYTVGLGLALREHILKVPLAPAACISSIRQHTSADVSICQRMSARPSPIYVPFAPAACISSVYPPIGIHTYSVGLGLALREHILKCENTFCGYLSIQVLGQRSLPRC